MAMQLQDTPSQLPITDKEEAPPRTRPLPKPFKKKKPTKTVDTTPVTSGEGSEEDAEKKDPAFESREFLMKAKNLLRHSVDSRKRYDYEWMVRDLYLRGYHFSKYQPTTNTIVLASKQSAKIPINLVAIQVRSICNQTTSFRPKWEVTPKHGTEESETTARYTQILLDDIFKKQKLKKKIKETVKQGLMFSVGGPWQIVYNKEKEMVEIWNMDTFDFFWDMFADDFGECQYWIKAVRSPLDAIKKNPEFNPTAREEIHGAEARLAVSENKQFLVQSMRILPTNTEEGYESIILFDGQFVTRDKKGKINVRRMVWTDQNTAPLLDEMMDDDESEYVLYQADLWPREILGESWMKHTMPINRVIDAVESSVFDYITRVAKGRLLVDKDAGVKAIHTTHGEIIRKNRGTDVRALEMPNLPNAVNLFIDRMHRYQEDIGGVHDSTLGRLPAGIRSGVGVAELKQSDSSSQDDLVDNLEDFLEEVARKVLKKISRYYTKYHVVRAMGYRDSEAKAFAVIGSKADKKMRAGNTELYGSKKIKIGTDILDLVEIGEENQVNVSIGSWLGYTKDAAQQRALELAQAGIIDQKEVLSIYEFGDIDKLIQRTRREKILQNVAGQPGANGGPNQLDLAQTENDMMLLEQKDMPVMQNDDHAVHIIIHQEALNRGADDLVMKHIEIHQQWLEHGVYGGEPEEQTQPQQQQPAPQGQPPAPEMGQPQMMPAPAMPMQQQMMPPQAGLPQ